MALLADEAAAGKTVIATTHDLAAASRHFSTGRRGESPGDRRRSRVDPRRRRRADPDLRRPPAHDRPPRRRPRRRPPSRRRERHRAPLPRHRRRRREPARSRPRAARLLVLRPRAPRLGRRSASSAPSSAATWSCGAWPSWATPSATRRSPGVVAAYLLNGPFYLGAAIAAVGTALAIGWVTRRGNLRGDTAIGVLFAGHVRARHLPVQPDSELRRRPVRVPVRRGPRDLRRATSLR